MKKLRSPKHISRSSLTLPNLTDWSAACLRSLVNALIGMGQRVHQTYSRQVLRNSLDDVPHRFLDVPEIVHSVLRRLLSTTNGLLNLAVVEQRNPGSEHVRHENDYEGSWLAHQSVPRAHTSSAPPMSVIFKLGVHQPAMVATPLNASLGSNPTRPIGMELMMT